MRTLHLTTRQRDLFRILLRAKAPVPRAELTGALGLTARQLAYALDELARALANKPVELRTGAREGVEIVCSPEQRKLQLRALEDARDIQLVLSHEQRQHLITLLLLCADGPVTLRQLQTKTDVSRTTIIKDLDICQAWLAPRRLHVLAKPNVGIALAGDEAVLREALCALLWDVSTRAKPLIRLTHLEGLSLGLAADRTLLPILSDAYELLRALDTRSALSLVAQAEAALGGRFSDDAVLYLALCIAIQAQRARQGRALELPAGTLASLRGLRAWPIARELTGRMAWQQGAALSLGEVGWLCMHLMCAPRDERWAGDTQGETGDAELITHLVETAAEACANPRLARDPVFRDGLASVLIPACLRQRYGLAMQPLLAPLGEIGEVEPVELQATRAMVARVAELTAISLPDIEAAGITLLLRAALTRERQTQRREVIVVCPSGMATAQLLVARLKAYFPRFRDCKVVSLRELNAAALEPRQLVITTLPLPEAIRSKATVIQVSPLLAPADVERITRELP